MTKDEKGYNGWANYETWAVNLWIQNTEGDYNYWRDVAGAEKDAAGGDAKKAQYPLSLTLKEQIADNGCPEVEGMYSDLLNSALSAVDWYEIAGALLED